MGLFPFVVILLDVGINFLIVLFFPNPLDIVIYNQNKYVNELKSKQNSAQIPLKEADILNKEELRLINKPDYSIKNIKIHPVGNGIYDGNDKEQTNVHNNYKEITSKTDKYNKGNDYNSSSDKINPLTINNKPSSNKHNSNLSINGNMDYYPNQGKLVLINNLFNN